MKLFFIQSKRFISLHSIFFLYLCMFMLVSIGIIDYSGNRHILKLTTFIIPFCILYFIFFKLSSNDFWTKKIFVKNALTPSTLLNISKIILVCIIAFIVYHFLFLGHIPVYTAWMSLDYYGIAMIRQNIIQPGNTFINYGSSFVLKSFIPFILLFFYLKNKKLFSLFLVIAIFYALALMQKSFIVSILIPLVIYLLYKRKYLFALLYFSISVVGVFLLVYITNPNLRVSEEEIREYSIIHHIPMVKNSSTSGSLYDASDAIYKRVLFTTGKVAAYWFDAIPAKHPFAKGRGYRFLAPILKSNYEDYDYARILYDDIYLKEKSNGLKGTLTVATFVHDYANFGYIGLIFSGMILSLILVFVCRLFNYEFVWMICFNSLYILWLSSAAISSTLLSGGWGLTVLLFYIFRNQFELFLKNNLSTDV